MFLTRFVLYVLLVLFLVRALRRFLAGFVVGLRGGPDPSRRIEQGVRMARDPICGTFVIPSSAVAVRDGSGLHHFCSDKCRDAFMSRARRSS